MAATEAAACWYAFHNLLGLCAVYTTRPGALVISSGPSSPAMNVSGVLRVPLANVGSVGIFIPLPPTPGTQSGILILFSAEIAPFMIPIIPLMTPLYYACQSVPGSLEYSFIPFQACDQLPEKTPVINWIRPEKICVTA